MTGSAALSFRLTLMADMWAENRERSQTAVEEETCVVVKPGKSTPLVIR